VLRFLLRLTICTAVAAASFGALRTIARPQIAAAPQSSPPVAPLQQASSPQSPVPAAPPARIGPTIVIDAAHGGTDDGAQGPNGSLEKDLVLRYARQLRAEFERLGYRVVMTRNDDSNPSYEDRAATANAYRDAIFITIHVSSTGKIGTVRAYSYQFSSETASAPGEAPKSLVAWEEAQRPYLDASHRLADILQTELAQRFPGSPTSSSAFAIRELRSVSAPAVAVELSSVSVPDGSLLASMGAPLAGTIVRSVQLARPGYTNPGNAPAAAPPRPAGSN
jgi:N-acetylmuramoyl-L-alanine amidase